MGFLNILIAKLGKPYIAVLLFGCFIFVTLCVFGIIKNPTLEKEADLIIKQETGVDVEAFEENYLQK